MDKTKELLETEAIEKKIIEINQQLDILMEDPDKNKSEIQKASSQTLDFIDEKIKRIMILYKVIDVLIKACNLAILKKESPNEEHKNYVEILVRKDFPYRDELADILLQIGFLGVDQRTPDSGKFVIFSVDLEE